MDAVTYPNDEVAQFLNRYVVPVKAQIDRHKDLARRYEQVWTPGLVWMDAQGEAHHRNVGYFEPHEFLAECCIGLAQVAIAQRDWDAALERLELVRSTWPESFAAPAALYWTGVAGKLRSNDAQDLLRPWRE